MRNVLVKKNASLVKRGMLYLLCFLTTLLYANVCLAQYQTDTAEKAKQYKNVIRYNLSGALLFGADRFIVFGYERVIRRNQSISINFGKAELPKLVSINTDSFNLSKDTKSTGFNASIDYRFYLPKENKYLAPHGLYIGPYYSYNRFERDNRWDYVNRGVDRYENSSSEFTIHTIGFELGYQFVIWKRMTLDFLMVGPGVGIYDYKVKLDSNIDPAKKEQLLKGLKQLLTQKFPGMNYVFSDDEISGDGTLNTTTLGYRYLIQIGFNF
jgi:hypothetical protein